MAVQFSLVAAAPPGRARRLRAATFREPEEALDALARGEVGAAFVWGPVAGYYNKKKLGGA